MPPLRMHKQRQVFGALARCPRVARWVAALCLSATACSVAHAAQPVRVLTEEFPPYNYTEQGRITGLGTEVVEAVLKELDRKSVV